MHACVEFYMYREIFDTVPASLFDDFMQEVE